MALAALVAGLVSGCEVKSAAPVTQATPPMSTADPAAAAGAVSQPMTAQSKSSAASTATATSSSAEKASETISAEGSSTVYPICQAFAVEFEKKSHHKVSVGMQGTGGGYKRFVIRQADIWNASRPIADKEIDELKSKGIDWIELNIAVDGIVIAVNPQNTWCSQLTCGQLKRIWEPDSQVKTWSDLDPAWPAEEIVLYGADTDSGTFEYFTEVINDKKKAINLKYTPASNDNILVQGISANKFALGFIPFGYYVESSDKLKSLLISATKDPAASPAPYVQPTDETILSGEYAPLARPLYMYVSKDSLKRPEVAEFMRFAVSDAAQPLIPNRGFVCVKEEALKQVQKKLEDTLTELSVTSK